MKEKMKSGSSMKSCQCGDEQNEADSLALHNSSGVLYIAAPAVGGQLNVTHPDKVGMMSGKSH